MPESHASFTKRVQRALLKIVEDSSLPIKDRLAASEQLIRIKGVKPLRKPRAGAINDGDSVLGTRG